MQSILFIFIVISVNPTLSSSSSSSSSYSDHCSSVVPQSNPTASRSNKNHIPYLSTPYITGGHRILDWKPNNQTYYYLGKSLTLRILPDYYETNASDIHKIDGVLKIGLPYTNYGGPRNLGFSQPKDQSSIRFGMIGFWSESSRKLCMVGSASWEAERGNVIILNAVLKLNYASESNSTVYTSGISGILKSTASVNDPAYFDPISIFSFPVLRNYRYSLVPEEEEFDALANESLSLSKSKFCSAFGVAPTVVELEYATQCSREPQHCSPVKGSLVRFLFLDPVQCSMDERKFRYTAKFHNKGHDIFNFDYDSVMVGEASWDDKNKHLSGVLCLLIDPKIQFGNAVGDCSMRLRMWYPSILTIRKDAKIAGQLWSIKTVQNSGYFRKVGLTSDYENGVVKFRDRRYKYTELDRVRESCPLKKPVKKRDAYPDAHSFNMNFDVSIRSSKGQQLSLGYASPFSIETNMIDAVWADEQESSDIQEVGVSVPEERTNNSYSNISYKIGLNPYPDVKNSLWFPSLNGSMSLHHHAEIMAEGVYNAETGELCMVGCRKLVVNSTYFYRDCEILVKLEFPQLNEKGGGLIKGAIGSRRNKQDPLYFEDLLLQSAAYFDEVAHQSIWRMKMEMTMVLISSTLACIFMALQIFYVKRNSEAPSSISVVMLLILCAGNMIPLVLNHKESTSGRLKANEVAVRVITMMALLLQLRLLQLVWTSKEKEFWIGEKKVGVVYILGCILALVWSWIRERDVWGDLTSYGGVVLDGFLLPQVLINIFIGSAEKALCNPFYIGTSAVRVVPHAYNQYRAHNYPKFDLNATYYYANPAPDMYSTAWDTMIPCGVVALGVVVFVQQRHGGRCILPQRFKGLEMYG